MKLLIDTHVLFWCLVGDPKLPEHFRKCMMEDAEATCVSAVSGWEIALKVKLGKWPEAARLLPNLAEKITAAQFEMLPVTLEQAERAGSFELFHRDPFDRLIAAQALDLDLVVATLDPEIAKFGCKVL